MKDYKQLKKDLELIKDDRLREYVETIALSNSYWESTKKKSSWHFDYSLKPTPEEERKLFKTVGRISANFADALLQSGELVHLAQEISPIMLPSEELDLANWGYESWGTDVINATGLLRRIGESIGFKNPDIKYNCQPPGRCKWNHIDSLISYIRQGHVKSVAEFAKVERIFIMLSPWEPGHFISFGNSQLQQWKQGDVVWFNWKSAPHATANAGHNPRSLLRLTGIVTPKSEWILGDEFKQITVE